MKKQKKIRIKVRDLKPKKDAIGGRKQHHRHHRTSQTTVTGGIGPDGAGKWDY
jgi:hypothetical protein